MNTEPKKATVARPGGPGSSRSDLPEWTEGLRRLYDEVVDEDLPDSFRDLLSRLDEGE